MKSQLWLIGVFILFLFSTSCGKSKGGGVKLDGESTSKIGDGLDMGQTGDGTGDNPAQVGGLGNGSGDGWTLPRRTRDYWLGLQNEAREILRPGLRLAANPSAQPGSPPIIKVVPTPLDFGVWPTAFVTSKLLVVITNDGGTAVTLNLREFPEAPFFVVSIKNVDESYIFIEVVFQPDLPNEYRDEMVMIARHGAITNEVKIPMLGKAYDRKVVAGAGDGGGPAIQILNVRTGETTSLFVGDSTSTGGVGGVAMGDVTGDDIPDIIVGSGKGTPGKVTILDGRNHTQVRDFSVFENFTGGVRVAVGDFNGDLTGDILVGAGPGGGPRISVYDGKSGFSQVLMNFFVYETGMSAGVSVAAGDLNGDGKSDVMVGPGIGGGPRFRAFDGTNGEVLANRFIGDQNARQGLEVASGYFNGDAHADIVASSGNSEVVVIDGATGGEMDRFQPYTGSFPVRVSTMYYTPDLVPDLIVGAGPGGGPHLKIIDSLKRETLKSYFAFPENFRGGIFVGGS